MYTYHSTLWHDSIQEWNTVCKKHKQTSPSRVRSGKEAASTEMYCLMSRLTLQGPAFFLGPIPRTMWIGCYSHLAFGAWVEESAVPI